MPCRDDRDEECDRAKRIETKRRLDLLTKEMCLLIIDDPSVAHRSPELAAWWAQHQTEDKARRAREKKARDQQRAADERRLDQINRERENIIARLKQK
jgi:hypothetical protein